MKKWSKHEVSFLIENWKRLSDEEIGRKLCRTPKAIFMKRQKNRLIQNKDYMQTEEYKKIMRVVNKKRYKDHPEIKKKQSEIMKYKCKYDDGHRHKISKSWFTPENTSGKNNYWYGKKRNGKLNPNYIDGKSKIRSYERLYSLEWKKNKKMALKRDKICKMCGTSKNLCVHHKIPYRIGKDHSLCNLVVLCTKCHPKEERNFINW